MLAKRTRALASSAEWALPMVHTSVWGLGVERQTWLGRLRHDAARLEALSQQLFELARRYDEGESFTARVFVEIGRAAPVLAPALAVLNPILYAQLLAAGFATGATPAGVSIIGWLVPRGAVLESIENLGKATGALQPGPVSVVAGEQVACLPPKGFAGLLERIPTGVEQVRIEQVTEEGGMRVIVYIGGTRDFEAGASTEPWDMTSNLQALNGDEMADSERAVREALAQAAVDAQTPVTLVGHSQGGLIASRIAASGDFDVTDLVVAGSPSHGVRVPERVRVTAFEHIDDAIPALSAGVSAVSATTLFIRQSAPAVTHPGAIPAHELEAYVTTARAADRTSDPVLRSRRESLISQTSASCVATEYRAVRSLAQVTSRPARGAE